MGSHILSTHQQLSSVKKLVIFIITFIVLLGGKQSAFALISYPMGLSFELIASGYIAIPFKEMATQSKVGCAISCFAMNHLCYAFSLSAMADSSTFLCKISAGNPAWVEDSSSELFVVSDKLKAAEAGGYSLQRDGRLYKKFSDQKTLIDSIRACVEDGGTLAPAYTADQKVMLADFFSPGTSLALGMFLENTSTAKWRTFNGEVFYSSNAPNDPLQQWIQQPTTSTDCIATTTASLSEWVPKACSTDTALYTRVCHRNLGYNQRPNKKFYKLRNNCPREFSGAQALCAAEGANLASLYTEEDFEAAAYITIQMRAFRDSRIYVGGTDVVTEGIWVMPNGEYQGHASYAYTIDSVSCP